MRKKPQSHSISIDAETVRAWAIRYLGCYDTTEERLRLHLKRKIQTTLRESQALENPDVRAVPGGPTDLFALIGPVIDRLKDLKLVDDARFAEGRAASLKRKGLPAGRIKSDLQRKGIKTLEPSVLAGIDPLEQAKAFAMRKKLGPFRLSDRPINPQELRTKEIAKLVRNGFPFAIAKKVIDGASD